MTDFVTTTGQAGHTNLEAEFLAALGEFTRSDRREAGRVYQLLMEAAQEQAVTPDVVYLLEAALKLEGDDVPVAACAALGSLENGAEHALPALRELALNGSQRTAPAAVTALGRLPSELATDALIGLLRDYNGSDEKVPITACDFLRNHVETLVHKIGELEAAFKGLDSYFRDCCSNSMDWIRRNVREQAAEKFARLDLDRLVPIGQVLKSGSEAGTPPEFDDLVRSLEMTTLHDLPAGRLQFKYRGSGQIGVTIVTAGENNIVLFTVDGASYVQRGNTPHEQEDPLKKRVRAITSAVCILYGLKPERTSCGYHVTPESGCTADQRDEFFLVGLGEYSSVSHRFNGTRSKRCESLQRLLQEATKPSR